MLLLYLAYSKDHILNILYDIIVPECSTMFHCDHVVVTVTVTCVTHCMTGL